MNKLVNRTLAAVGTANDFDCIRMYDTDPDGALAILYSRYSGMLHRIGQKYYSFTPQDIDSFVWVTLYKAVVSFNVKAGANFATYVTRLMNNTMKNEFRAIKVTTVQRDWFMDVEWECNTTKEEDDNYNVFNTTGVEVDWSYIDLMTSLPSLPLTEKQYAYVSCIISNGSNMTDAEVAREIGVSRCTVSVIKKSLSKKLQNFLD